MKTAKFLPVVLFAVTLTYAGAWAQDQGQTAPGPSGPPENSQVGPGSSGPQEMAQTGPGPGDPSENSQASAQQGDPSENSNSNDEQNHSEAARVSYIHGDVSMQRGDSSGWSGITLNTPLAQGDQIATGDQSRAEVQLDYAHTLRVAGQSQVKIANLSRNQIQVQVAKGFANLSSYQGGEAEIEIDSPNVAVRPVRGPSRVRVQVSSDDTTDVIVRSGEVEISTPQGSTRVHEGQVATIRGIDNPEYKIADAPNQDDWDRWNRDRDGSIQNASSWHNTNHYYTGSNDLDSYGRWVYVPGYGNVWQPNDQGPNWAPYQDGRWAWEPYWGWTWVSAEPWGWAPYHYGRWFFWDSAWVWWPGPVYPYYRPFWSPAFVSFFGFGGRVGFGFGFGTIGWFPVGPFDPFFPWFGRGFRNFNVVNINVINIHNRFGGIAPLGVRGRNPVISNVNMAMTNARVRGGMTTVSSTEFARGGVTGRSFGVDANTFRGGHVVTGNVGVVPSRESLQVGRAGLASTVHPSNNSRFFSRSTPPAGPAAFHEQAARVQQTVGRGQNQESMRAAGASTGARLPAGSTAGQGAGERSGGAGSMNQAPREGWHSFSGPSQQAGASSSANRNMQGQSGRTPSAGVNSGNGWNRFSPNAGSSRGNFKPPLEMNKPLVTPRSSPSYGQQNRSQPASPQPPRSYSGGRGNTAYNGGGPYGGRGPSGPPSNHGAYGGGGGNHSYSGGGRGGYSGGHSGGGGGGHSGGGGGHR